MTVVPGMEHEARLMLILLVVNYAIQMLAIPFTMGHHVHQRFLELNMIGIGTEFFRIALLIVLLVAVGPSVLWVVVARVLSEQVYLAIVLLRSHRLVPQARFDRALCQWTLAQELVSFGFWTSVGQLALIAVMEAGTLILNTYGTALDVTNYYLGTSIFKQISGMVALAASPLLPAMTAMHALEDRARLARTTSRGARYGLWVSLFAAAPLAIYSHQFVQLYLGNQYEGAAVVLSLLMTIFIFKQARTLLPLVALATAQVKPYHLASLVTSCITLVVILFLVRSQGLGSLGVATGLLGVTTAAELVYFWPLQLQLARIPARVFLRSVLMRGWAPAAVASVAWALLSVYFPLTTWMRLVLSASVGSVVYLLTLTSCLDRGERNSLNRTIRKALRRPARAGN